ncbi:DUF4026 domain-containing protein [Brachyspira hyodysenteriae]|nr:DUF4026 domain-containing protein [Brachyspira hyodysenteriae]MCZ9892065.1 DUF4026 domain-containing protein [Brachyspira hyodysenteriae]MCZ9989614.1 DUF4026 domain-containing protein [Brachyspira hyodysenteriae]MCZ9997979.1 DUF4026 domain-containing protein [Brachyspira hyodysenteriae]MDA0001414.1 DUF4026 domain-containing protein [Brachyspira hyodysenteriae]MDA0006425.1 DUF4026 domain-containing protein [Brachyspira hyodysenteriae]
MDYNEKLYNVFSSGEQRLESWMAAVFTKEYDHNMTIDEFRDILSESDEYMVLEFNEIEESNFIRDKSKWEASIKLQYLPMVMEEDDHSCGCGHDEGGCCQDDEEHSCGCGHNHDEEENNDELSFYVALVDASSVTENVPEIFSVNTVREDDYKEACQCKYAVHVSTIFDNHPLTDYQRQLKLLDSLVPECSIFLDMSCYTAHSGDWLSYTSTFALPPSLDYLYTIHAVYDDDKDPNKVEYWFHTHGLYRVGSIELEIVGVEDSNAAYGALLNTCAKMFIERGVPEAGFKFNPAYNTYVCWFPWQEALKKLNIADDVTGSAKDRNDGVHNTPSGILLAVDADGNYHSLDYYKNELTDNPMFMMSYFETSLMREAAFEKLEYFLELLNKNKGDEKTSFLVKLGYGETEENPNDLEHLWFDVHGFTNEGYFDATLINEPYKDLGMHEGDRGMHSIERLTDWEIYTEENNYNSRNIYLLFQEEE